ncbi:MAG TPA: sulfite reductase subunit A, partial [Blastocatellia bacterium]
MQDKATEVGTSVIVERGDLQRLIDALLEKGYRVIGPILRDGAIIYDEMTSVADLPEGWTDEQDGGMYRVKRRNDDALFGFNVGPHSWKKFLHPADVRLSQVTRDGQSLRFVAENDPAPKFAFIGARSCDLHAIAVQDLVFLDGPYVDPIYQARREQAFIIAVNCGKGGGTCFCVSMKTGPKASFGFDLAMTEALEADRHYFVVEVGTERGAKSSKPRPTTPRATPNSGKSKRSFSGRPRKWAARSTPMT